MIQAVFANLIAGNFPNDSENRWVTKVDRRRLISWSNTALSNTDGAVECSVATGYDITERKPTAMLLNASESLQCVTTTLLQHLTTLDDVLVIVCNEAFRLTGATGSAVLLLEDKKW